MDEYFLIHLRVANRLYPIKIKRSEEEAYRRAADIIDKRLSQYKERFIGQNEKPLDNETYITMAAIQEIATKAETEIKRDFFDERIKQLSAKLDKYLEKNLQ